MQDKLDDIMSALNMIEASLADIRKDVEALNKEQDQDKPKAPLIKDEKIRKAVRAWAEANNVTKVWHEGSSVGFCDGAVSIKFHELCWEEIPKGDYTIAELCGEEEE